MNQSKYAEQITVFFGGGRTIVGGDTGLLVGLNDVGLYVVGFDDMGFGVPLTPSQCSANTPHQPCWLQHSP